MYPDAILKAWRQIISPPFRRILWRSLALTLALIFLVWLALTRGVALLMDRYALLVDYPLIDSFALVFAGIGIFIALAFLIPPISALVAGYFLDDAAEMVERMHYPADPPGRPLSFGKSILYGLRFAGLSLMVNAIALVLLFVPGVNLVAFFGANAYLLGREYFELAAGRFQPMEDTYRYPAATDWAFTISCLRSARMPLETTRPMPIPMVFSFFREKFDRP